MHCCLLFSSKDNLKKKIMEKYGLTQQRIKLTHWYSENISYTGWSTDPLPYPAHTVPHAGVRAGLPTVFHHGALRPRVSMQPTRTPACRTV